MSYLKGYELRELRIKRNRKKERYDSPLLLVMTEKRLDDGKIFKTEWPLAHHDLQDLTGVVKIWLEQLKEEG